MDEMIYRLIHLSIIDLFIDLFYDLFIYLANYTIKGVPHLKPNQNTFLKWTAAHCLYP